MSIVSHLLVGTSKGLLNYFISNNEINKLATLYFAGFDVTMGYVDPLTSRWWAGVTHKHWGQKLHYSDDEGETWLEASLPSFEGRTMPDGSIASLRQIWVMSTTGNAGELWLGTDPGGLFKSENNGQSWKLVESLWNHPTRQKKDQWFGAGSVNPFIHTIRIDPRDSKHIYVGISCAGVFESTDQGASWNPVNNGLVAAYLPNPGVEVGHDPHCILISASNPDIMWQQNHCGVFLSKNGGKLWQDVSVKDGLPYYGFALAIDDEHPSRAWVIPVESDAKRIAPGMKLQVYTTEDFGANWYSDSEGLPENMVFDIVLRQAFVRRDNMMVFGTTNGNLYAKVSNRGSWNLISSHLTKINTVVLV